MFEADLEKALLLSKLEYEEHRQVRAAGGQAGVPGRQQAVQDMALSPAEVSTDLGIMQLWREGC